MKTEKKKEGEIASWAGGGKIKKHIINDSFQT